MTLKAEPLTAEAFAPFGTVIETDGAERHSVQRGNSVRFHRLAAIDPGPAGRAILSILRARRWPERRLTRLERHPAATMALVPLTTEDWALVVAGGERPAAADCRLFHAFGDQGVQLAAGVWHHPVLVLAVRQDFLVIDRDGAPGEGVEEIGLDPPALLP